jgi:hypothetical protein
MKHPRFSIPMVIPALVCMLLAFLAGCGLASSPEESQVSPEPGEVSPRVASAEISSPIKFFPDRPGLPLLAADGKPLPIIVSAEAPPFTREAAGFLAENIERIGGVRPEVLTTLPDPLPPQAIWVGYQPAMDALFPEIDFTFNHPEEIILGANENHVAITGRDRWDPKFTTVDTDKLNMTDVQQEYGGANAVFTFLQDVVGVRWLYPGELGTDYPAADSLQIPQFTYRYHPQFRNRSGLFHQLRRGRSPDPVLQGWVKHQRLLLDSLIMEGGHPFVRWHKKFWETKPEIFALQPDGTRGTFPRDPESVKFCVAEPAFWQAWLDEMAERFEAYPYWEILPTVANDGYLSGHCVDPRSKAWDPDPSETDVRIRLNWANRHIEFWPPLSDRYANLANKLSELAAERFPDREYYVLMSAYGDVGRPAPVKTQLRDNVMVRSVHNFHMRHSAERELGMKQFDDWSKVAKHIIWRPNLGNQAGLQWGFPDVPFQQTMEDIRFVAERGAKGIFFDMFYESWANLAPYYYLVSQLGWNPYADGNAILEDYFVRCYGPAAPAMREYWLFLEKTRQHFVDSIESRFRVVRINEFYTEEVWQKADSYLKEAEKLTANDPKYAARVHFTRCGFHYARALVEQRSLMVQLEGSKPKDKELEQLIRDKWVALEEMVATFPEHAVNFGRMRSPGRTAGLHPDAPLSTKKMRDNVGLDLD